MTIDDVVRVRGRPVGVLGKLSCGEVRVGQAVKLRLGDTERAAVVAELSLGFDRVPPQRACRGDTVVLWLRGDGLDIVREGEPWQVVCSAPDAKLSAATDRKNVGSDDKVW